MPDLRRQEERSGQDEIVRQLFASPFVSDLLCQERLGHPKHTQAAAARYLALPVSRRPEVSDFFDSAFYGAKYPDIGRSGQDPLLQFLSDGCSRRRSPHPLIDPEYMRSIDLHVLPDACGPGDLHEILHYGLVDTSPYFSIEYYRGLAGVAEGFLTHFLKTGLQAGLRPNYLFDPLWYYRQLGEGQDVWSGLRHFVLLGDLEGRAPSPEFSGRRYLDRNPDVAAAGVPALAHYLINGKSEGRPYYPERINIDASETTTGTAEAAASDRFDVAASILTYQRARREIAAIRQQQKDRVSPRPPAILHVTNPVLQIADLALPRVKHPKVSILIPVYNALSYTVECIGAVIRSRPKTRYDMVIADDASTDGSAQHLMTVRNIKLLVQPSNVGFLANCNAAFRQCTGDYVLLLNNDAQLMPGALDALVEVLDTNPDVAAVGPRILYPDGRLQEAGCTLDRDGVATMVGLFADPNSPDYNRERDVHYCSGAALLLRRCDIGEMLFDEAFKPAYCEDADLCLRLLSQGRRVVYCPRAEVVHHLSVSTARDSAVRRMQLIVRNQQKLARKWATLLDALNTSRIIAFYLPQYHPTPENDLYWGMGFTEWTNVAKAVRAYEGHYQPHIPADLGFYDLRVQQTVERQVALARRYGIGGFCVYYYNFGTHRTLDQAFEAIVANPAVDFPYCVCWANENWTRHWDGGNREIILQQQYDHATLCRIIQDAVRYASDARYLRVDGKPLFLVYRPLLIPDPQSFAALCRQGFRSGGFSDVHLVYVESMETAGTASNPDRFGFDACVEFPPHGRGVSVGEPRPLLQADFRGMQYDYEAAVAADLRRPPVAYKRYPAVFPSWDNTPRHQLRGDSFINATPEFFQAYVEEKLDAMRHLLVGDERLLFVNAWNEWAEGAHLEPDRKFGHRWLEAIRNALMARSLA
jgi:GT2 family glycosyltransferase